MSGARVLVLGDGPHELGHDMDCPLSRENLPALPRLVDRLLGHPAGATYVCSEFAAFDHLHGKGPSFGLGMQVTSNYSKKVIDAILTAWRKGYSAVVILIDRDRWNDAKTIIPLKAGRDEMRKQPYPPCAVGMAVETFDAWMIADGAAVGAAGGDAANSHPQPENMDGKEGTGNHPKERAAQLFGGGKGRGAKYALVAEHVDLDRLANSCPKGFKPFAKEVRDEVKPVLDAMAQ